MAVYQQQGRIDRPIESAQGPSWKRLLITLPHTVASYTKDCPHPTTSTAQTSCHAQDTTSRSPFISTVCVCVCVCAWVHVPYVCVCVCNYNPIYMCIHVRVCLYLRLTENCRLRPFNMNILISAADVTKQSHDLLNRRDSQIGIVWSTEKSLGYYWFIRIPISFCRNRSYSSLGPQKKHDK